MKKILSLFLCISIMWTMLTSGVNANEIVDNAVVTQDNVMALLESYDTDGAFILQYAIDRGEDVMVWWRDTDTTITSSIETAVHEECHGYSYSACSFNWEAIYIGDGNCIQVPYTEVYKSEEMARTIPDNLRTFRYETYIGEGAIVSANGRGAYGLLNEFTAYCWGFHNVVSLYPYYEILGVTPDTWHDFIALGANGRMAYAEFKYYILMYLEYARQNYPTVYEGIINNEAFCDAYLTIETIYADLIYDYEQKLQEIAETLTLNGYPSSVDGDWFRYPKGGSGIFTSDYEKLIAEIEKPVYQEIEKTLWTTTNAAKVAGSQDFVTRMYQVCLGRTPDEEGLGVWTDGLVDGTFTGQDIANGFIMSDEFQNKGLDNSGYVDAMYAAFFGREADADGKQTWVNLLDLGTSRKYVMAGFVNSEEFAALCADYGIIRGTMDTTGDTLVTTGIRDFVLRIYEKVLQREGEAQGVLDWSTAIGNGTYSAEDAAKLFFSSDEFIARELSDEDYVETLYQTFMGRASDPDGKNFWLQQLVGGMGRNEVLKGFSRSTEFGGILESFGL